MSATLLRDFDTVRTKLIVDCGKRLVPLFKRSFTGMTFVGKGTRDADRLNGPDVDYHIPIASLGRYLRQRESDFADRTPYLNADPSRVAKLREKYKTWAGGKPVIGISWHSGNLGLSSLKSIPIDALAPILCHRDYAFVSLQYGDVADQLAGFRERQGVEVLHDKSIDPMKDMDGFAAQVAAMDQVISISNTTVHMAGALGIPTRVMLSNVSMWCWQRDREDTLWYDTVRLFRQEKPGDWSPVIEALARTLTAD